jgi:gluconokinase
MAEKPPKARTRTGLEAKPTAGDAGSIDFPILIVAGVSGSGKTTVATALAQRLGLPFEEGDRLHPPPDITKMHSAHPLDDREQWSWLEKIGTWITSQDRCRRCRRAR